MRMRGATFRVFRGGEDWGGGKEWRGWEKKKSRWEGRLSPSCPIPDLRVPPSVRKSIAPESAEAISTTLNLFSHQVYTRLRLLANVLLQVRRAYTARTGHCNMCSLLAGLLSNRRQSKNPTSPSNLLFLSILFSAPTALTRRKLEGIGKRL